MNSNSGKPDIPGELVWFWWGECRAGRQDSGTHHCSQPLLLLQSVLCIPDPFWVQIVFHNQGMASSQCRLGRAKGEHRIEAAYYQTLPMLPPTKGTFLAVNFIFLGSCGPTFSD